MRNMISPGMIVADIGSNIGIYTRMFSALTGATGQVHAFEPAPTAACRSDTFDKPFNVASSFSKFAGAGSKACTWPVAPVS
ncbi:hypothetical protein AB9F35_34550, partial [Rhizobium leguminosarum]